MAARKVKKYKVKLVNWYQCVYCKAKFWWWLLPFTAGGRHEKTCQVLTKGTAPKFKTTPRPRRYMGKPAPPKVKTTGKTN